MAESPKPKIIESDSYELSPALDATQLRNSIMAPQIDASTEIQGRIESSDGNSVIDLNDGIIQFADQNGNIRWFVAFVEDDE